MKKILVILTVIVVLFGMYKITSNKPTGSVIPNSNSDLVLFWGNGCPHCAIVEKFINDNNISSKIPVLQKEVYYDKDNQADLQNSVKNCNNIDSSQGIGVPLMYIRSTKTCIQGDTPIIDFLKQKTNTK